MLDRKQEMVKESSSSQPNRKRRSMFSHTPSYNWLSVYLAERYNDSTYFTTFFPF
jgi:hypothetical protein